MEVDVYCLFFLLKNLMQNDMTLQFYEVQPLEKEMNLFYKDLYI